MTKVFSLEEVAKHNTKNDCWCVIHGEVYDLTKFLPEHPGGKAIILKYAGKDATKAFDPIHPKDIIQKLLPPEVNLGKLNPSDLKKSDNAVVHAFPPKNAPAMSTILNLYDFELVARNTMSPHAWAYYSSGSDDELTLRENVKAFHRIWLKPRVLVNVRDINLSTKILGFDTTLPIYITATALGKLGHPEGETVLTKAAHSTGIIQMIPTLSSCSMDEIIDARPSPDQNQFLQLYVNANLSITEKVIKRAEEGGVKAIFITVDAPELGRREKDMRMKAVESADLIDDEDKSVNRNQGAARAISSFIDPSLSWDKLSWFRKVTKLPLALKGIQCGEDAVLAAKHGMDAIVVSNHGGRQVDLCRSAIEVLPEVVEALDQYYFDSNIPKAKQMEIYIDGGIRRGSDIFKAIALGAKAVGIGRPFLYAMSTYGQQGVEHAINILRDELFTTMRLMGTPRIQDIHPGYLDTKFLNARMNTEDTWSRQVYEPISLPQFNIKKDSKL